MTDNVAIVLSLGIFGMALCMWKYMSIRCKHKWELYEKVDVWGSSSNRYPVAHDMYMKCVHCGEMKKKRM